MHLIEGEATARETGSSLPWGTFLWMWARIGCLSFGGPAGQIALMHRELVEERGWLDDRQYLGALNFCMLLPGPEAQQLATWCGWRLKGTAGGLAAGLLFVLPGAVLMAALAALYLAAGDLAAIRAALHGVQAVVVAVVAMALWRVAARTLHGTPAWTLALGAFVVLFLLDLPFPLVILVAAIAGVIFGRLETTTDRRPSSVSWRALLKAVILWLAIWLAPTLLFAVWLGDRHEMTVLSAFFTRMAALSFGGAYAAMTWVAQAAVDTHGWLTAPEMLIGLGLAESTPGPLVLVFQFVGAVAGARMDGPWNLPSIGAALGMVTVLWVTFAPSFLWIFALAPHLEQLTSQPRLAGALSGISAAVVGVMANLALWFALHLIWPTLRERWHGPFRLWEAEGTADPRVIALALLAFAALQLARLSVPVVVLFGAVAGYAFTALPI